MAVRNEETWERKTVSHRTLSRQKWEYTNSDIEAAAVESDNKKLAWCIRKIKLFIETVVGVEDPAQLCQEVKRYVIFQKWLLSAT